VKKSQAIVLAACWWRKSRQLGPRAPRRRLESGCEQQPPHGAGRHAHAELQQLTRNPWVTPAWILARETQNELSHPILDCRTARWPVWLRPLPTHEFSMPAQKRLRRDDQPMSAPTREYAGQRREEGTIGCFQRGARLLAPEHDELMS
jgi:hypothetical protein